MKKVFLQMEFTEAKLFWYLAMLRSLTAQSKDSPLGCRASRMLLSQPSRKDRSPCPLRSQGSLQLHARQCCRDKATLPHPYE